MSVEKVIIQSVKYNDSYKIFWVTDNNNREIGIPTTDKKSGAAKNLNLKGILEKAKAGDELEIDLREWNSKFYGDEPKASGSGGGKSFPVKDKSYEAALAASQAAGSMMALQKEITVEKFVDLANGIHLWIMSKKSS